MGLSGRTWSTTDKKRENRKKKTRKKKKKNSTPPLPPRRRSKCLYSSSDFSDQIFFHVSEVIADGESNGEEQQQQQQSNRGQKRQQQQQQSRDIAALVAPGTEVEFTVGPVAGRAGRQAALRVKTLPPGSLDPYDVSEERLVGVVERELRGGEGGGGSGSTRRGGGGNSAAGAAYGGRLLLTPAPRSEGGTGGPPESLSFDAEDLALMGVHDSRLAALASKQAGGGAVGGGGVGVGFGVPPFDPGPRPGETVEFSVATDKKTGERRATLVARRRERGIVVHTKRSNEGQGGLFGFIRLIDRRSSKQQIYFHESQVVPSSASAADAASTNSYGYPVEPIKPGDEVTMGVAVLDAAAGRASALAVQVQPLGTFPDFVPIPGCERVEGRVVAGGGGKGGALGAGEGALSIAYIDEETGAEARVLWKAGVRKKDREEKGSKKRSGGDGNSEGGDEGDGSSGNDGDGGDDDDDDEASAAADASAAAPSSSAAAAGDSPTVDDDVVFTLARSIRGVPAGKGGGGAAADADECKQALNVELVRRGSDRREFGAVAALKGSYGLIRCCDRPGTVLFRYEEFALAEGGEEGGVSDAVAAAAAATSSSATAAADAAVDNADDAAAEEGEGEEPSAAAKLARASLSKDADVEFSIARDAKGRAVAARVRRAPAGSAVFETVSAKVRQGWVVERLRAKGNTTVSSGVVEFFGDVGGGEDDEEGESGTAEASAIATAAAVAAAAAAGAGAAAPSSSSSPNDPLLLQPDAAATAAALAAATAASIQTGPRSRLPFTAGDLSDPKVNPRVGDAVVFRVATDPRVARAAARRAGAGSLVARIAGRRASRVAPLVLRGSVAMTKGAFGFLEYDANSLREALAAGGGAAGVEAAEKKRKEAEKEVTKEEAEEEEVKKEEAEGEEAAAAATTTTTTEGGEKKEEGDDDESSSSKPSPAADAALPPPAAVQHKTRLRVYFRAGEVEAVVENGGSGEKGEGGAATTPTVPVLRRGDLVEFTLAEKPKTRESMAHRVKKIGDAPGGGGGGGGGGGAGGLASSSSRLRLFVAERNPQGIKFTSNAAAGVRGNLAVRLAKCPPEGGARGFTPETSPGSRAELVAKYLELKAAAEAEAAAEAARLNPQAAEFVPPPGLGAALVGAGGAAADGAAASEEAAAAAVAKLAVAEAKEEGGGE